MADADAIDAVLENQSSDLKRRKNWGASSACNSVRPVHGEVGAVGQRRKEFAVSEQTKSTTISPTWISDWRPEDETFWNATG